MADLEAEIREGRTDPVYVLHSDDALLVDRVIQALQDTVVTATTRALNYDVFEAKAAGATAILNAARTLPMMGPRRLCVGRGAEELGAQGLEPFIAYLDDPTPTTVLALVCGKVDGRMKFFAAAKKKKVLHDLSAPRQIFSWIQDEARRRGARLTSDAVRRLHDVIGRDLMRLSSAIDQLALYVGEGRPVSADDVDELIAETRERNVFELTRAVGEGDRLRALLAVARLFDQRESAIGVTMMLQRHFRQLALTRAYLAERVSPRDLPRLVGVPPFAVDSLVAQARRFDDRALSRALALLAQTDLDLKGPRKAALTERLLLERVIEELLGAR